MNTEDQDEFYEAVGTETYEDVVDQVVTKVSKDMELTEEEAAEVKEWLIAYKAFILAEISNIS